MRASLARAPERSFAIPSSFTSAWLEGTPGARAFLPLDPRRVEDRALAVEAAATQPISPAVRSLLADQNDRWQDPRAVAVVTGQQAGLFLGPLYTFYKAAHAIALARRLSEEADRPVLPVFWVASEDHDLAEVASCVAPGEGTRSHRIEMPVPDERPVPVAYRRLGDSISRACRELEQAMGTAPAAAEMARLVERHYRPEQSWPEAFAGMLREVFEGSALAIVDPRHPALLEAALPIHRRAFERADGLSQALLRRGRALADAGYGVPVHVRPGAPLPFVHPDGVEGERFRVGARVEGVGAGWPLVGTERVIADAELRGWLREEPGRFSSSALLRPVVQDLLLPNVAYVGGPGEIAYLAQTPPLYAAFERTMPLVVPRVRIRIVGARERRLCEQLSIAPEDAMLPRPRLLERIGAASAATRSHGPAPEQLEEQLLAELRRGLGAFASTAEALDPGLAKAVARTLGSVTANVTKLGDRYRRVLATRDDAVASRVDRLRGSLAPDGGPQERVHGLPAYAARFGLAALRDAVDSACDEWLPTQTRDLSP